MQAQLEIVTRRNGRFVKVQDVLVEGVQIATLTNVGTKRTPSWRLTWTDASDPIMFSCRDDACTWLYLHFTYDPPAGPLSLRLPTFGMVNVVSDREAYEARAEYEAWLDTLPSHEQLEMEGA